MVASAGRRPGLSRRAQYGLFFGFVATVGAILVGLIMLILSLAAPSTYAAVRGVALDVTAPAAGALNEIATTATGLVSGAGNYWDAARQNARLKRQRDAMLHRMIEAKAITLENIELKRALSLRERERGTVAAGRVVGSSFSSPRRFASRVLLVSDRANIVPARLVRGGIPVIATGRGDGTVDVRPLEVGRNPFRRGDIIVTSGTGGLYPPLWPIARIVRLDDDGAIARPLADPGQISFALVERPFEPEAIAEAARAGDAR